MTIDVETLQARLLEERARVAAALDLLTRELQDAEGSAASDNHIADPSVVAVEREIDSTLEESAEDMLAAIDAAIARIAAGTYGLCGTCGKPIAAARLEALPYTDLCVPCKRLAERR